MAHSRTIFGNVVLSICHVAGMVDMVALPLWVGALIGHYHYDPAQAGAIVTLFLLSVVAASSVVAPAFGRLPHRLGITAGFALAAAAFYLASRQPVDSGNFVAIAGLLLAFATSYWIE